MSGMPTWVQQLLMHGNFWWVSSRTVKGKGKSVLTPPPLMLQIWSELKLAQVGRQALSTEPWPQLSQSLVCARKWRQEAWCCWPTFTHLVCLTGGIWVPHPAQFLFLLPALMSHLVFNTFVFDTAWTHPRIESCEISQCCQTTPRKQEAYGLSFLKNKELLLECVFVPLLGVAYRSELISDHSLLLPAVIQLNVPATLYDKTCFCHVGLVLVIVHSLSLWEL